MVRCMSDEITKKELDKISPISEENCFDLFSQSALDIEKEWSASGLAKTMYEEFARACFNCYLRHLNDTGLKSHEDNNYPLL